MLAFSFARTGSSLPGSSRVPLRSSARQKRCTPSPESNRTPTTQAYSELTGQSHLTRFRFRLFVGDDHEEASGRSLLDVDKA